ncbi:transporter substrate-binding protein [Klebsiella variicola subsp. variicola]|nr:transporter substrate-binding protein [Klebsiella variicola subsp. variicola]
MCKFKQSLFLTAKAGAYGARYTHQYWFTLLLQRSDGGTQELSQWRGATQAIAEINQNGGINGRPLNAIHLDPQSDDVLFRAMAEELITEHEVNVIFGGYTSSSRKAMSPIVEKYRRLLFYSQLYEGF